MLFGQSVFQSVIERLKREADENTAEGDEVPVNYRVGGMTSGFVINTETSERQPGNSGMEAYMAFLADAPPPPEPEPEPEPDPMPTYLEKTSLEDVANELDITERDTLATLTEKRRRFARLNHPDSVRPQFRQNATLRMTAANLLIDQAIRMLRR
ncbi:hypothetical protein [Agrobacterium sp. NPDC090273]|uniref:hypothetical protein n=1 Tax=Agrobacterium sp. NPDC090273 TaxID=3363919 RepID=UPI00383A348C